MKNDRAILSLALGEALIWAAIFYSFPALLLRFEADLGWSKTALAGAITTAILISAALSPVAGRIIDVGRGPHLMAGSAILGGFGLVALSCVGELWQFYGCWALIGTAMAGCLYEPCFALVTRSRGAAARRPIITITLIAGFASTISFPAAHAISEIMGWRTTVIVFAGIAIMVAAPLFWFGGRILECDRVAPVEAAGSGASTGRGFLTKPVYWFLATGFTCGAIAHGATVQHLLPILDWRAVPTDTAVLVASLIGPSQVAGRLIIMGFERQTSNHGIAVAALLLMGLSLLILLFDGQSMLSLLLFVGLFGGAYGTVSVIRPLITRDILGGENFGAKSGALALPYLCGSALAPFLGAQLWGLGGYDLMLLAGVSLGFFGCLLYWTAHRLAQSTISTGQ